MPGLLLVKGIGLEVGGTTRVGHDKSALIVRHRTMDRAVEYGSSTVPLVVLSPNVPRPTVVVMGILNAAVDVVALCVTDPHIPDLETFGALHELHPEGLA